MPVLVLVLVIVVPVIVVPVLMLVLLIWVQVQVQAAVVAGKVLCSRDLPTPCKRSSSSLSQKKLPL